MKNNIDPKEITKFQDLAEAWWNPEGELKSLHDINPLRLKFIQDHASIAGKSIIDVGCGGGILTEALAKQAGILTGIDMSENAISAAQKHAQKQGLSIDYRCTTAEDIALQKPGQYDIVTCMELLEHLPDPLSVIQACSTLAKPGASLFFSTLNRNVKSYLYAILGAEYLLKLLPRGTHDYTKFIRPSELDHWGSETGLDLIAMAGISYRVFEKEYYLTDDVSVNYLAVFSKMK